MAVCQKFYRGKYPRRVDGQTNGYIHSRLHGINIKHEHRTTTNCGLYTLCGRVLKVLRTAYSALNFTIYSDRFCARSQNYYMSLSFSQKKKEFATTTSCRARATAIKLN